MKTLLLAACIVLSACGANPGKSTALPGECVGCAKPADVKLSLKLPPPLDLSDSKRVSFVLENGKAAMSYQDFIQLQTLISILEGRVIILQGMVIQYQTFYEAPAVPRKP